MGDLFRAWSEEAIDVGKKRSGQEQLGSIMRVTSATGSFPTEKTGN